MGREDADGVADVLLAWPGAVGDSRYPAVPGLRDRPRSVDGCLSWPLPYRPESHPLSAHFDDDGTVPVVFFYIDGATDLTLGRHQGRIEKLHQNLGHMGRTNYHWAMDAVIDHYLDSGSCSPALVVFQTDGGPTSRIAAERYLCKAARLPLFWQFVGFGDPDDNEFAFLRKLDTLAVPATRVVDNAGFFHAGRDPQAVDDQLLYNRLLNEFPTWLTDARAAGVIP